MSCNINGLLNMQLYAKVLGMGDDVDDNEAFLRRISIAMAATGQADVAAWTEAHFKIFNKAMGGTDDTTMMLLAGRGGGGNSKSLLAMKALEGGGNDLATLMALGALN